MQATIQKPFLKWAGNKIHCLRHIVPNLPKAGRLIEPFTGSGAIFLNTDYPEYLLTEINKDLVNLYQLLQQDGVAFIDYCQSYFTLEQNTETRYYEYRELFNTTAQGQKRAALFLYLNRHGYKGLCRYRSDGGFNVPYGFYVNPYFPRAEMNNFHQKSSRAKFLQGDFSWAFQQASPGDIVYCDPPYVPLSKTASFTQYSAFRFEEAQQIKLKEEALKAQQRGITVLISNHDTPLSRELYQEATIHSFKIHRLINTHARNRKPAAELLAVYLGN